MFFISCLSKSFTSISVNLSEMKKVVKIGRFSFKEVSKSNEKVANLFNAVHVELFINYS